MQEFLGKSMCILFLVMLSLTGFVILKVYFVKFLFGGSVLLLFYIVGPHGIM